MQEKNMYIEEFGLLKSTIDETTNILFKKQTILEQLQEEITQLIFKKTNKPRTITN